MPRTSTVLDASPSTELVASSSPGPLQLERSLISEEPEERAPEVSTVLRWLSLEYSCTFSGVNDFNNYGDDAYMSKNYGRTCAIVKSSVF
jgi:hypothetical protein